jgi:3-oxoacyl-[acyl-carrier protein] reductase
MRGLADSLRNELRDSNIKVTSIYPGAVDSMFWDNLNVDFPRNEMMNSSEIAGIVYHSIAKTGIGAIEDIVIRRTKGDF